MGPTCNGRMLLTLTAAAIALLLSPLLAWGQPQHAPTRTWQKELTGKWCDLERGCTNWWTTYDIIVRSDNSIVITQANRFPVFFGKIREPLSDWIITVKTKSADGKGENKPDEEKVEEITVLSIQGMKRNVKGKFSGKITLTTKPITTDAGTADTGTAGAGPAGARQKPKVIEIGIPIEISDATIEGDRKTKEKDDTRGGADTGEEIFDATIKGKIESPAGLGTLKGYFEGKFKGQVEASIKGVYWIPPPECSEAGRPLSDEEKADLKQRRHHSPLKDGKYHARTPGRYRSPEEVRERGKREDVVKDEKLKQRKEEESKLLPFLRKEYPGFTQEKVDALLMQKLDESIKEYEKTRSLVAYAQNTRSPRPAEPHTQGTFMRKVSGTVSAIEPANITLELPPLPVLDHKCSVIDELPKRTLKLVKQHDGVR